MSPWIRRAVAVLAFAAFAWAVGRTVEHLLPRDRVTTGEKAAHGAHISRYEINSAVLDRTLPQTAVAPPGGGAGRPLLVFLHGKGGGPEESVNGDFLAALAHQGRRAPDVIFPSGGGDSYWHARRSGDWGRYVLDEVIPEAIRRLRADPKRIAIGGISMGGFGAYDIARDAPGRFCAIGGHSPALWRSAGAAAPGAFDDATDFARNDLIALARAQARKPWIHAHLWLDVGTRDPFRAADDAFARAAHVRIRHYPGGHTPSYWHMHYRSYLRFYAHALGHCR